MQAWYNKLKQAFSLHKSIKVTLNVTGVLLVRYLFTAACQKLQTCCSVCVAFSTCPVYVQYKLTASVKAITESLLFMIVMPFWLLGAFYYMRHGFYSPNLMSNIFTNSF